MKVAISTINDYENYGNRLQNYALQEVITSLGNDVITIKNYSGLPEKNFLKKTVMSILGENSNLTFFLKRFFSLFSYKKKLNVERAIKFRKFTSKNIKESKFIINKDTANFDFDKKIDCYVVGSDQVWNYFFPRFSSLDFIEYSQKPKISYAASFGVKCIPQKLHSFYKAGLSNIDYISVREHSGKKIVSKLTDKSSKVVLDPTLLLSKNQWMRVSSNKKYTEKYVVVYFLGDISDDNMKYIKRFSKEKGYEIKKLLSYDDEKLWKSGPSEFISLFSGSEAVFTDSFHAVAFSIIFNKYFEVFERNFKGPSMNSRIDTLLGDLDLADRWHSKCEKGKPIDYYKTMKLLDIRKRESMSFLKDSLKRVEVNING
ncbi:hypothetical protein C5L30_001304 [Companilactobacillus farciminis]|uniref:Polysaccharide pyruvyl transferase domain-containing protein n=1 Tax=Companilactobacillus farciminis TaxID=1612 RepID=A0A4R5NH06_9LACO|nr:polysaccharide pyruvyl transferase family protein [Companilactobacillus farciminis]ATO45704.1 hypothetical protein LF20184_02545 [Companilactobacillus farciminis KCTC 3681 = DSM 20184]KRK62330.1 hypothetical protein FC68_GL002129 [Companilactobacillus farciminis KCTC 3681 = DSM 20184]TDG73812.1 hypothetical protein C5L30_001304 [Companilactobacillus farciminis]